MKLILFEFLLGFKKPGAAMIVVYLTCLGCSDNMNKSGTLWAPFLEWSLNNTKYTGNPFDVSATVTFTHETSGEQRKTEMFYDEDDTWKFRFSGTRTGKWIFKTISKNPDLNGKSGTITISPNHNSTIKGFVAHVGNKWARQIDEGEQLKAFVPNFVQAFGSMFRRPEFTDTLLDEKIRIFFDDHGFNGFYIFGGGAYWVDYDCIYSIYRGGNFGSTDKRNPDPRTFRSIEKLISRTHAAGGLVHIWCYGDGERQQDPTSAWGDDGARTEGERRLLRYIAARLGPLPGWIMGYGFDVPETATPDDLRGWGNYLRGHMGWKHYLTARNKAMPGGLNYEMCEPPAIPYTLWPEADFFSRGNMNWDYNTAAQAIDFDKNVPHSLDERFMLDRVGKVKDDPGKKNKSGYWNAANHIKGLWAFTMAGGISALWSGAELWEDSAGYEQPYRNQIKTFSLFWENRFLNNLQRANELTNGWALQDSYSNYIFYKDSTTSIRMDLSKIKVSQPAIAIDTQNSYKEINLEKLEPIEQIWQAPYLSTWVVAVGKF
jgi:hypothetical protein